MTPESPSIKLTTLEDFPRSLTHDEFDQQAALLHDVLRVAAGLPPRLPPIDLFKRERPCRRCA